MKGFQGSPEEPGPKGKWRRPSQVRGTRDPPVEKIQKKIGGEWAKRGEPRERPRSQTPGKIEEAKVAIYERNREGGAKAWTP